MLLAAALVIGLAGCTDGPVDRSAPNTTPSAVPAPATTSAPAPAAPAKVWRWAGMNPVSAVRVLGSTAVGYGVLHDQLYIYGLDAATGRPRWNEPAATSSVPDPLTVTPVGTKVAYFQHTADSGGYPYLDNGYYSLEDMAELVVADPRTGAVVSKTIPEQWVSQPVRCAVGSGLLCASVLGEIAPGRFHFVAMHIDPATGAVAKSSADGYLAPGAGLIDINPGEPSEKLAKLSTGRPSWTQPISEIFGPGVSLFNGGWSFATFESGEVIVGTLYRKAKKGQAGINLADQPVTAAISARTGDRLWVAPGTDYSCIDTLSIGGATEVPPVRCRYSGSVTFHYPKAPSTTFTNASTKGLMVTLEGYDPRTGARRWQRQLGDVPVLAGARPAAAGTLAADQSILVPAPAGTSVLDLQNGALTPASSHQTYWCGFYRQYHKTPTTAADEDSNVATTDSLVRPCDKTLQPTAVSPSFIPESISATFGDLRLVATPASVVAYKL